jgi:hypothetical protein
MKDPFDFRRMTCSIEEHAFAHAVGYTDGAWLELARRGLLKETLLDERIQRAWAKSRVGPRRPVSIGCGAEFVPTRVLSARKREDREDRRAQSLVDLAFRVPRRRRRA